MCALVDTARVGLEADTEVLACKVAGGTSFHALETRRKGLSHKTRVEIFLLVQHV